MSKRLMVMVHKFLMTADASALAKAVGKNPATVHRWIKNGHIPLTHNRYRVALACGSSEEEAVELSRDASSEELGQRTA